MKRPDVENYLSGYLINGELVQSWDFPRAAENCGWTITRVQVKRTVRGRELEKQVVHLARRPAKFQGPHTTACAHRGTDGTVDCPMCGVTVSDFIRYAAEYLDSLC